MTRAARTAPVGGSRLAGRVQVWVLAWSLVAMASVWPSHAVGRDMTGKAGLGVVVDSRWIPNLSFRYWQTRYAFELLASWSQTDVPTGSEGTADTLQITQWQLAAALLGRIGDAPRASLALGLRPWLQVRSVLGDPSSAAGTGDGSSLATASLSSRVVWGVEVPLEAEFFLNDHLGITASAAVGLTRGAPLLPGTSGLAGQTEEERFAIDLTGVFSGGLGLHYYF